MQQALKHISYETFEITYRQYWQTAYSVCYYYSQSRCIAEDLVQDIFQSLWKRRREIVIETSIENYLIRAAKLRVFIYICTRNSHEHPGALSVSAVSNTENKPETSKPFMQLIIKVTVKVTAGLIEKYHQGLCTWSEQQAIEQWLADPCDNDVPDFPQHINKLNVEKRVWDNINKKASKSQSSQLLRYSIIAAVSLFIISFAVWLENSSKTSTHPKEIANFSPVYRHSEIARGKKDQLVLADSIQGFKFSYQKRKGAISRLLPVWICR